MKQLPKTLTVNGNEYCLFIAYGVHGKEWQGGYRRYFEYSEPEDIFTCYGESVNDLVRKVKNKARDYQE